MSRTYGSVQVCGIGGRRGCAAGAVVASHDSVVPRREYSRAVAGTGDASRRQGPLAPVAVVAVLGVFAAASVSVASRRGFRPTTYAATSTGAAVADLLAGLGSLAAGALVLAVLGRRWTAALLSLVGMTWLAGDWIGWEHGSVRLRSLAMVLAPFLVPVLAHLALAYPTGRLASGAARLFVGGAYAITVAVSVGWALFRDPRRDADCWSNCDTNVFLVRPERDLTRWLTTLGRWAAIAVAIAAAVGALWRMARASAPARRTLAVVVTGACVALAALARRAALLLADPSEDPTDPVFTTAFLLAAAAVSVTALGAIVGVAVSLRRRHAVARLAASLDNAPAPGDLRDTLAVDLGDPHLQVVYWSTAAEHFVDDRGHPIDARPGRTQAATAVVRRGHPVATIIHDRTLLDDDIVRELGAAARLAVDNERYRAEIRSEIEELRASRARIVATADATRRQLERDLHDTAQQRLLAMRYELSRAAANAADAGDEMVVAELSAASAVAERLLARLRETAHGIFPAILAEGGLEPALRTFADIAPLALEVGVSRPAGWIPPWRRRPSPLSPMRSATPPATAPRRRRCSSARRTSE